MSAGGKESHLYLVPSQETAANEFDPYSLHSLIDETLGKFQEKRFITIVQAGKPPHTEGYTEFHAATDVLKSLDPDVDKQKLVFSLIQQTKRTFDEIDAQDMNMDHTTVDEWSFEIARSILGVELGNRYPEIAEESTRRVNEFDSQPQAG